MRWRMGGDSALVLLLERSVSVGDGGAVTPPDLSRLGLEDSTRLYTHTTPRRTAPYRTHNSTHEYAHYALESGLCRSLQLRPITCVGSMCSEQCTATPWATRWTQIDTLGCLTPTD